MIKKITRALLFLVLLVFGYSFINAVSYVKESNNSSFFFFSEPQNTIDVIFLGSSQVYCGVNPLLLWHEKGYTAYNLSTSLQPPWGTYSLVKSAIERQHPEVIAIDVFMFTEQVEYISDQLDYFSHRVYDPMPLTPGKVREVLSIPEIGNKAEILFPLILNHSRLQKGDLKAWDFDYFFERERQPLKGFEVVRRNTVVDIDDVQYTDSAQLPETAGKYLQLIIDYCKKKSVPLLLIRTPGVNSELLKKQYNRIEDIAKTNEVSFLNLNDFIIEIGIDLETDFTDNVGISAHLNADGAQKVTTFLGDYLAENYRIEDHRADVSYSRWQDDYLYYVNRRNLDQIVNPKDYFAALKSQSLTSVIAFYKAKEDFIQEGLISGLMALGAKADFSQDGDLRYYALVINGEIEKEILRLNKDIHESFYLDDAFYSVFISDSDVDRGISKSNRFSDKLDSVMRFSKDGAVFVYDNFGKDQLDQVQFDMVDVSLYRLTEEQEMN